MTELSDLNKLVWPFPQRAIKQAPKGQGGTYVKHSVVEQRLLMVVGPPRTSLVQTVRGDVAMRPGKPATKDRKATPDKPALIGVVCGVVLRMEAVIDSEERWTEEAGDTDPHNWAHDGERLKDAMSDAYKRCAMRLGVGLHLRCDPGYDLHLRMQEANEIGQGAVVGEEVAGTDDDELEQDAEQTPTPTEAPERPDGGAQPERPATGEQGSDAGQATAPAPPSGQSEYTGGAITPETRCPNCGERIGNHTVKKVTGLWVHRVCPRDKAK